MKVKRISLKEQKYGYDIGLLFVTIFLCIFGLIMIYSASYYTATVRGYGASYYLNKQLVSDLIGLGVLVFMSLLPYRFISSGWVIVPAYFAALVLMILTTISPLGHTAGGRTRWITLFGQTFQTAEIVKIGVITILAFLVMQLARKWRGWKLWGIMLLAAGVPTVFIFSNDLSSAALVMTIPLVMIVILNGNKKFSIVMLVLFLLLLAALIISKPWIWTS